MSETITISREEYNILKRRDWELGALERAGVKDLEVWEEAQRLLTE